MNESLRAPWVLALSLAETLLVLLLLVLVSAGLGLGYGYYLGNQSNPSGRVLGLCEQLASAHEQRAAAVRAQTLAMEQRLQTFEAFLLDTGLTPTLPLVSAGPTVLRAQTGQGGSLP